MKDACLHWRDSVLLWALNAIQNQDGLQPEQRIKRARILYFRGKYTDALRDYSEVIKEDPNCAQAYAERAGCFFALEKKERALEDLNQAVKLDDKNIYALHWRACVLQYLNRLELAIEDFSVILKMNPVAEIYEERGGVYENLGMFTEAIEDYSQAIHLNPSRVSAHLRFAHTLSKRGEFEKSLAAYSSVIDLDPSCGEAWLYRATAYYNLKNYGAAMNDIDRATKLCPDNPLVWSSRGWIMYCLNDYDQAEQSMRHALVISPQSNEAKLGLASVLATSPCPKNNEATRANEALALAQEIMEAPNISEWEKRSILAEALARSGKFEEAVQVQGKVLEIVPSKRQNRQEFRMNCYLAGKPFIAPTEM